MIKVKRLNITGDSNIENLHIVTRRPGKSIGKITLSRQCAESNMQIHFEIQTDKHRSIYKDDDEVIKTTYSVQDLIDILQEDTDESSEIFETLQFKINGKGIDII